jgi:hypothetical protein
MVRSPGLSITCLCQAHVPLFQTLCQMVVTDCWFFPVLTYMPQDFRSVLFKQQRERSEKRRQAEVDALVAAGGSIHDKYLLLWRQQMDRRHQLAQLGSSTGVLRTIVKWLVGVPQVLLDFVCRINDDNGPMEEQRQRYGPPLYELTSFSIALRVFVSLWWSSFDHPISYVTLSSTMVH